MYLDFGSVVALVLLFAILFVAWFWNDSLRSRDRVIATCSRLCSEIDVQFLDETVALSGLRIRRGSRGSLEFIRRYTFEYSRTGSDRWNGSALFAGMVMESVQLHGPDGTTILGTTTPSTASHPVASEPGGHDPRH